MVSIVTPVLTMTGGTLISTRTIGNGNAGDIAITVGRLTLADGAQISSSSGRIIFRPTPDDTRLVVGTGKGGTVQVTATDAIVIAGRDPTGRGGLSGIASATRGPGQAGRVEVSTPQLIMADGGQITTETQGTGRGGDVVVQVGRLSLTGGAQIRSSSIRGATLRDIETGPIPGQGTGPGGTVTVTATDTVSIAGRSSTGGGDSFFSNDASSGLFSTTQGPGAAGAIGVSAPTLTMSEGGKISVRTTGAGRAGDITVKGGTLTLTGGALMDSSTDGAGRGGTVRVTATDTLTLAGTSPDGRIPSGIGANAQGQEAGAGNAGSVVVEAPHVLLTEGAQITSSTVGPGQGGAITVTATDTVAITGRNTGLATSTMGSGQGGEIALQARQIQLTNGAAIAAESTGTGNAGSLTLTARDTVLLRGHSAVTTAASEATGGNIRVTASSLVRLQNSQLTATVGGGTGDGGNVTIDPEFIVLQGSQITANAVAGHGGRIDLTASKAFLADPSSVVTASSTLGINGDGRHSGAGDEYQWRGGPPAASLCPDHGAPAESVCGAAAGRDR